MKTNELRERFLNFFKKHDHRIVKSASLIPHDDPTLLFTGAGMNQFKDYFMGIKKDTQRATSSQKCLRTGDLDNVGTTAYHHSFFEMLGNFSFADYFKEEAIVWAWDFLTEELSIAKDRLFVSVHKTDEEAFGIWEKTVGLNAKRISRFGDKDNFWPANAPKDGPNGPCGPCSEIFFDQGERFGCGKSSCGPDCDCNRYAEIWNLVFTQFDRKGTDQLEPLPFKNIDTGMGLERLACVMQGKLTNFEIDIFEGMIRYLKSKAKLKSLDHDGQRKSVYMIADHFRASAFSIADGAYPSNEGRGYVIRKLIRRAVWNARKLGFEGVFMAELLPLLGESMSDAYPELRDRSKEISEIITAEENRFLEAIEGGMERLTTIIESVKKSGDKSIVGEDVFQLYDTFGFPDELTRSVAAENDLEIDEVRFQELMSEQREQARAATKISDSIFASRGVSLPDTEFLGYDRFREEGCEILALQLGDDFLDEIAYEDTHKEGEGLLAVNIYLDKTPFYAESGGQVGDKGTIGNEDFYADIVDTQKVGNVFYHKGILKKGTIRKGDKVVATISEDRPDIMRNHTATHLLHAALRKVLGEHVRQMGSVVRVDKLRFDFSFQRAMTTQEIKEVEDLVNAEIEKAIPVDKQVKSIEEAKKEGAMAFFGDKYGDEVRVLTIGDFSKELCGGTHVNNTADIKYFKITRESSISSGTRRIEAKSAQAARDHEKKVAKLKEKEAEKKVQKEKQKKQKTQAAQDIFQSGELDSLVTSGQTIAAWDGIKLYPAFFKGLDKNGLLRVNDFIKEKVASDEAYVEVLIGHDEDSGKLSAIIGLSDSAKNKGLHAGDIAKKLAVKLEGSGGGKDMMAFAGGTNVEAAKAIVNNFEGFLKDNK